MPADESWDLFISHASEDKEKFVKPLADLFTKIGVKVWYDQFTLRIGDSLSGSIDRGLAHSKFGLVVISRAFISKKWPDYELRGLTALELAHDGKKILPIWHNITRDEVPEFSPTLADKYALSSSGLDLYSIVLNVAQIVRPDIYRMLAERAAFRKALENSHSEVVPMSKLAPSPIRHKELPQHLLLRIKLTWRILQEVMPMSLDETIISYHRDLHPVDEVERWEWICAVYLDMVQGKKLTKAQKKEVFDVLLLINSGHIEDIDFASLKYVTVKMLREAVDNLVPHVDLPLEGKGHTK